MFITQTGNNTGAQSAASLRVKHDMHGPCEIFWSCNLAAGYDIEDAVAATEFDNDPWSERTDDFDLGSKKTAIEDGV